MLSEGDLLWPKQSGLLVLRACAGNNIQVLSINNVFLGSCYKGLHAAHVASQTAKDWPKSQGLACIHTQGLALEARQSKLAKR